MDEHNPKPKVLIVEDDFNWQKIYQRDFGDSVEIIAARTIKAGFDSFLQHPDIAAMIMDGKVGLIEVGDDLSALPIADRFDLKNYTTAPLIKEFRDRGFTGPIIAASGGYTRELIEGGASHQSEKGNAPEYMLRILAEMSQSVAATLKLNPAFTVYKPS